MKKSITMKTVCYITSRFPIFTLSAYLLSTYVSGIGETQNRQVVQISRFQINANIAQCHIQWCCLTSTAAESVQIQLIKIYSKRQQSLEQKHQYAQ